MEVVMDLANSMLTGQTIHKSLQLIVKDLISFRLGLQKLLKDYKIVIKLNRSFFLLTVWQNEIYYIL